MWASHNAWRKSSYPPIRAYLQRSQFDRRLTASSETWFDLKNRTTMTMLCAVSNPLGGAVASLVGPATSISELLLAVAIASTAVGLFSSFLPPRPPTAPSPSADSRVELSFFASIARLRLLKTRDRIDFAVLAFVFTIVVAFFDAFLTLTNIIFEPEGYSSDQAGYIGAAVIGAGLVGAIVTAPILDRPLRHHFATTAKVILPIMCAFPFANLDWSLMIDVGSQRGVLLGLHMGHETQQARWTSCARSHHGSDLVHAAAGRARVGGRSDVRNWARTRMEFERHVLGCEWLRRFKTHRLRCDKPLTEEGQASVS